MKANLLKHRWIISVAAAVLLGACSRDARLTSGDSDPLGPSAAPPGGAEFVGIVPPGTDVQDVIDDNNLISQGWLPDSGTLLFQAPSGFDPGDFLVSELNMATEIVGQNGAISFYEWDSVLEVDGDQGALLCLDLASVHTITTAAHGRIAVLDTGLDKGHPFLVNNLTILDDPVLGLPNLKDEDPEAIAYGHGTHVAGVIVNVAPAAEVVPFKVLGADGKGTVFKLVAGIDAAVAHGVEVINLSLSVSQYSSVVHKAITRATNAGVLVIAAAGNDTPGGAPAFPASLSNVIAVAATEGVDGVDLAPYSAWHPTDVAFAAPGTAVYGAYPRDAQHAQPYSEASGTSTACAVVSGSFLLALNSGMYPLPEGALEASAVPVNPAGSVLHGRISPADAFGF